MAVTQYIGARYVPIFADPIEWSSEKEYEPLTIVTNQGNSYTSRQFVPVGISIDDGRYWVLTGNYNAQVEAYRQEVMQFDNRIDENTVDIAALSENLEHLEGVRRVFQTTSEMSQDLDLRPGDMCHTLGFHTAGDGGAAWYLIVEGSSSNGRDRIACTAGTAVMKPGPCVSFEQFGAYGDGSVDDSDAIGAALSYASENALDVLSSGTYLVSNTIEFPYSNMSVHVAGTLRTLDDITVLQIRGNRNNIYVNKLEQTGTNYTGVGINLHKETREGIGIVNCFNNIKFNECLHFSIGVKFSVAPGYGNQYNVIDFEYILAHEGIVYDVADVRGSWVTQNAFYNGRLSGDYGFVVRDHPNMDYSNNNMFVNIGFEDITQSCLVLNKLSESTFDSLRMLELNSIAGKIFDLHDSFANVFSGAITLKLNQLSVSFSDSPSSVESALRYWNKFECTLINSSGGGYRGVTLVSVISDLFMTECIRRHAHVTMSDRSAVVASEFEYLFSGFTLFIGASGTNNITYTLPYGILLFPDFCINVNILFLSGNATMKFVLPNGTTLIDQTSLAAGKYLLKLGEGNTLVPIKLGV